MVRAMLAAGKFYAVPQQTYAYRKEHRKIKWQRRHTDALFAGLSAVWKLAISHQMPYLQQQVHANLRAHFARVRKHLTASHNAFIRQVECATNHHTLTPLLEPSSLLLRFMKRLFIKKTITKTYY